MLVGSTLDCDHDSDASVADDDGVFSEAWPAPRHSHGRDDDDDDDDAEVLRGSDGVEQRQGTRLSRDGVWTWPTPWLAGSPPSVHSEDSTIITIHRFACDN